MKTNRFLKLLLPGFLVAAVCSAAFVRAAAGPGEEPDGAGPKGSRLKYRGLYTQFDRRGYASMYYYGEAISGFFVNDPVVGHSVAKEISLQLDKIREMGVNTITYELRSCDPTYIPGPFAPPKCNLGPALGFQYPQPTSTELANFKSFLDLLQSKGMKLFLRLVNTHMEEQPPTKNAKWLGAILNAVKDHPVFELALFEGNTHLIDTNGDGKKDDCGPPAEPPLWMGPKSVWALYVKWAIGYGLSCGVPARKLSAEAIVGDYFHMKEGPSGPAATDWHLWSPIKVLKGILDDLSIPVDQRTYAISFYERRKCSLARGLPCVEMEPHAWANETLEHVFETVGRNNGARVIATEMGLGEPVESSWTSEQAMESLVLLMKKHGVEGGSLWQWVSSHIDEDSDPTRADPVKIRGIPFVYNPVKDVLVKFYALDHAVLSPNGGEKWKRGAAYTIRWTYSGDLGPRVKIELLKGEVIERTIALSVPIGSNGEGSFRWKVPADQKTGSDFKIRVTSRKYPSYVDDGDRSFRIVN